MTVIAITGGIATGKSTLSRLLIERGYRVINADQISRQAVAPESVGLQKVIAAFGTQFLQADGSLNRAKLGQLVFADDAKLKQLNEILQPLIRKKLRQLVDEARKQAGITFFEIPLLFEEHYEEWFDQIIVVSVSKSVQIQRLMERNQFTKEQACNRINSQLDLATKRKCADFVFDNTRDVAELEMQVQQFLQTVNRGK